jgi:thioredoxin 1
MAKRAKFSELINGEKPVLIDFHAVWCGPCKMMKPVLKEVAEKVGDKVRIIKIDVDKNPNLSKKFQIRGVPTIMLFKSGKAVWQRSGVQSTHKLLKVIEEFG